MSEKLLLTVSQAGEVLALGRTKLLELVYSGQIESLTVGRRRYIRPEALEQFVERLRQEQDQGAR